MTSAAKPLQEPGMEPANDAALRAENAVLRRRVEDLQRALDARRLEDSKVSETMLNALRANYVGVDDEGVVEFLRSHPLVASTLLDAVSPLVAAFDGGVTRRLRMPLFREAGDPLIVEVNGHGLSVAEATEREERFASEWWDAEPFDRREWLVFTVGFE